MVVAAAAGKLPQQVEVLADDLLPAAAVALACMAACPSTTGSCLRSVLVYQLFP